MSHDLDVHSTHGEQGMLNLQKMAWKRSFMSFEQARHVRPLTCVSACYVGSRAVKS